MTRSRLECSVVPVQATKGFSSHVQNMSFDDVTKMTEHFWSKYAQFRGKGVK